MFPLRDKLLQLARDVYMGQERSRVMSSLFRGPDDDHTAAVPH
jgi:hypothetical protein